MSEEIIHIQQFKPDKYYQLAYKIVNGEAGGDYLYCTEEDKFYEYRKAYWKSMMPIDFLGTIEERFKIITKYPISVRKQIIENFKSIGRKPLDIFNNMPLINLQNYMFDPLGLNTLLHKKEHFSTIQIPYRYDEKAKCPLWIKSLDEILEGNKEKFESLQEFIGYCLTPDVSQKKALLFIGDSNTGKSTILFILRYLIGEKNCSSVPLKFLSNPQYTPMLVNKMVNIDADVDKNAKDYEAEFKIITSGEPVACNQKFVATFEFVPKCKIILAANSFPRVTDHSSAFYKRLILIPLTRIFEEKEQNKQLKFELLEELPGILNWAVEGLQRLNKRGIFEQYDYMWEAISELRDESNPIDVFFRENIVTDVSGECYLEKEDLYRVYREWCFKNGNAAMANNKFGTVVFAKYSKFTPKTTSHNGKRIWRNLRYVNVVNEVKQDVVDWRN